VIALAGPHFPAKYVIGHCSVGEDEGDNKKGANQRKSHAFRRLGIERISGQVEPEDHAAVLLAVMAGVADGRIAAPAGADREIFEQLLAPWMERFFSDLENAELAAFYAAVGTLGRVFMGIEAAAYALPT
jgi:TorA maturation chaperone TorD